MEFVAPFSRHEFHGAARPQPIKPSRSLRALSAFAVKLSPNLTAKTRRAQRVAKNFCRKKKNFLELYYEFHEYDHCDLDVIGLKYNFSQPLRPRCLTRTSSNCTR
ncbi:MAG: hypothetical protein DMG10_20565 [Acidobacteria bacterium]|nr:MAG: hypothetical protein DMG10_20565 [Acidobacteriota bacterium]